MIHRSTALTPAIVSSNSSTGVCVHMNCWRSGEGVDVTVIGEDKTEHISLHSDTLSELFAMALSIGYVDIEEVQELSKEY